MPGCAEARSTAEGASGGTDRGRRTAAAAASRNGGALPPTDYVRAAQRLQRTRLAVRLRRTVGTLRGAPRGIRSAANGSCGHPAFADPRDRAYTRGRPAHNVTSCFSSTGLLESGPTGEGPDLKRSRFTEEQIIAVLREQEAGAVVADRPARQARRDRQRQRHRVHLLGGAGLHPGGRAYLALHRAGQTDPERICRELSGADARRMPQRAPVLFDEPRPRRRRRLGRRLQHRTAALGDRLHDASRLRRDPEAATSTGAAPPRKLRTDARCYCRANAQFSTHDSSSRWMSDGGHVRACR